MGYKFYADEDLYDRATGNKALIKNGRITPFRFYGERDPKELNYDLRAVSFCRYGSGFVTKSSPIVSGVKDTRPPVLFGKPQPANGILTLENNITLRFSEPIAGNWLDEDNNFQLRGVTNTTGITQSTSPYLGGQNHQFLMTNAGREMAVTDLSIDMLIRPASSGKTMTLFAHGDSTNWFEFRLTADNRLQALLQDDEKELVTVTSRPMGELSTTDFTRVIMVYNFDNEDVRFYVGTMDITDDDNKDVNPYILQNDVAPILVGTPIFSDAATFHGNVMEVRVWTKALTPDEIVNTHMRRLTGYEHGLMDYYPMDEGEGEALTDLASGATLYGNAMSWTNPQGISVALNGTPLQLRPECFTRSAVQDYTLMGWFRLDNNEEDHVSLFATYLGDSLTMELAYDNKRLTFRQDDIYAAAEVRMASGGWYHVALVVSKAYNVGSLYIDGKLVQTFSVSKLSGINGTRMLMGKGLRGNIDDVCLFEQALPASLVREYVSSTPAGDEMGLIALLPFSEMKRNASNIMELVFSINDQRVFRDALGNVVEKVVPLLLIPYDQMPAEDLADRSNFAPVKDRGQLTNLNFNWSYNNEELLINLRMQDREINRRTIYLTVRDVEDINGNRLPSPVSWTVYADLNSLRWNKRTVEEKIDDASEDYTFRVGIYNSTGMTRQYTIDKLPIWLECTPNQGTLEAKDEQNITFTVKKGLTPGKHNAVIFLTDDNGLTESLVIDVEVLNVCPWGEIDTRKYHQNMSLRAQVFIENGGSEIIDTDKEDIIGIFCNGELLGKGNISSDDFTRGYVYITVYGDAGLNGRMLTAQLWRHSVAKTFLLTPDVQIRFKESACLGCPPNEPVRLTTSDNMMQAINLGAGWNWISFYLKPYNNGDINTCLKVDEVFTEGDEIKTPANRKFCQFDDSTYLWIGSLKKFDHHHMYMMYTAKEHTIFLEGITLQSEADRSVKLVSGWNVLPYLRQDNASLRDALGDYYPYATEGDMIKNHDEFAVFSDAGKWEGNLTYMRPGCGYLLYRKAASPVTFIYPVSNANANASANAYVMADANANANTYAKAATNMTMIARIDAGDTKMDNATLYAYIGSEQVGVATPITIEGGDDEGLYFLTISSNAIGSTVRFETEDGTILTPASAGEGRREVSYEADAHYGSLTSPVVLTTNDELLTTKVFENGHIIIIRGGERYDTTGKRLTE